MTIVTGVVLYLLIWWVVIFCILPLDIQSITDAKETGNMPGAPQRHGMVKKVILTTIIAFFVWLIVDLIIRYGGISFQDIAAKMPM